MIWTPVFCNLIPSIIQLFPEFKGICAYESGYRPKNAQVKMRLLSLSALQTK
jgi:hypothetical protein